MGGIPSKSEGPTDGVPSPASGTGFGNAKRGNPKYTTCRDSLPSKDTRDRAFPDLFGVPGFSSQRLCSSVGFGPADAQGAEEKKRVVPNPLQIGRAHV